MSGRITRRALLGAGLALPVLPRGGDAMELPIEDQDWSYVGDTVMGGVSTGSATWEQDGGRRVLRLTGEVSTENRGGFIQMRMQLPRRLSPDAEGLALTVRGNGERYFVHLRTGATRLPWQYYQAPFDTTSGWRTVRVPFAAFRPSGRLLPGRVRPDTVRSIGIVAYGRDHSADLSLAALSVY